MKSRHYKSGNLTSANISRRSIMKMMAFGLSFGVLAPVLPTASAYAAETAEKSPSLSTFPCRKLITRIT